MLERLSAAIRREAETHPGQGTHTLSRGKTDSLINLMCMSLYSGRTSPGVPGENPRKPQTERFQAGFEPRTFWLRLLTAELFFGLFRIFSSGTSFTQFLTFFGDIYKFDTCFFSCTETCINPRIADFRGIKMLKMPIAEHSYGIRFSCLDPPEKKPCI